jgi:hypothetical protein
MNTRIFIALIAMLCTAINTQAATFTVPDEKSSYWKMARIFLSEHTTKLEAAGQNPDQVIANTAKAIDWRLGGKGKAGKAHKNNAGEFQLATKIMRLNSGKKEERFVVVMGPITNSKGTVSKPSSTILAKQSKVRIIDEEPAAVAEAPIELPLPVGKEDLDPLSKQLLPAKIAETKPSVQPADQDGPIVIIEKFTLDEPAGVQEDKKPSTEAPVNNIVVHGVSREWQWFRTASTWFAGFVVAFILLWFYDAWKCKRYMMSLPTVSLRNPLNQGVSSAEALALLITRTIAATEAEVAHLKKQYLTALDEFQACFSSLGHDTQLTQQAHEKLLRIRSNWERARKKLTDLTDVDDSEPIPLPSFMTMPAQAA